MDSDFSDDDNCSVDMDETEDEITLQEAIETQEMLEKQSVAVLGASDPQNCSYAKGYIKRQALYACLTCHPKGAPFAQPAAVCLACSYTCHEGHEMVELFTKRNFRCDCGNKKFPDNPCRLQKEKEEFNSDNVYNQNFSGMYCSCHRPYPDPDCDNDVADDAMLQCIICEDWFHFQHSLAYLNLPYDAFDEDFELICGPCMSRLEFLEHYSNYAIKAVAKTDDNDGSDSAASSQVDILTPPTSDSSGDISKVNVEGNPNSMDSGICSGDNSCDPITCTLLKTKKEKLPFTDVQAVAWKETLRSALCRCAACITLYEGLKISYLLDEEDTIEHYEAIGKKNLEAAKQTAEDSINNQVNQLGRVGQLEFIHGYNDFKEQLADFLKSHAESGKVVQREDVMNFFAKVNDEKDAKRRRLN